MNLADREAWLRLAEDWMKLARGTELICASREELRQEKPAP
jgi:hypothetical protein